MKKIFSILVILLLLLVVVGCTQGAGEARRMRPPRFELPVPPPVPQKVLVATDDNAHADAVIAAVNVIQSIEARLGSENIKAALFSEVNPSEFNKWALVVLINSKIISGRPQSVAYISIIDNAPGHVVVATIDVVEALKVRGINIHRVMAHSELNLHALKDLFDFS